MFAFVPSRETLETMLCYSRDDVHLISERQFILSVMFGAIFDPPQFSSGCTFKKYECRKFNETSYCNFEETRGFFFDLIVSTTKIKLLT